MGMGEGHHVRRCRLRGQGEGSAIDSALVHRGTLSLGEMMAWRTPGSGAGVGTARARGGRVMAGAVMIQDAPAGRCAVWNLVASRGVREAMKRREAAELVRAEVSMREPEPARVRYATDAACWPKTSKTKLGYAGRVRTQDTAAGSGQRAPGAPSPLFFSFSFPARVS